MGGKTRFPNLTAHPPRRSPTFASQQGDAHSRSASPPSSFTDAFRSTRPPSLGPTPDQGRRLHASCVPGCMEIHPRAPLLVWRFLHFAGLIAVLRSSHLSSSYASASTTSTFSSVTHASSRAGSILPIFAAWLGYFSLTVSFKVGSRYIKGVWGGRPGSPISRPTPIAAPRLRHSKAMHIRGPQSSLPTPRMRSPR